LRRLAAENRTGILLVEHKTALLDRLADSVVLIAKGRIVRAGPAVEVLGDPALADHGVEPPPRARIRAAIAAAGLDDTGVTDALLLELAS
jgi:molybdate transport system ATP-binding protein